MCMASNVSATPVAVKFEAFDFDGNLLGTLPSTIEPQAKRHLSFAPAGGFIRFHCRITMVTGVTSQIRAVASVTGPLGTFVAVDAR